MTALRQELANAMTQPVPTLAFRESVKKLIDEGADKGKLCDELDALRAQVSDAEEDVVLEILDFLAGWSHPDMRL